MSKRKVYNYTRRTLAFLMAMIMTLSVLQGASITAFAQTGSDVVETESTDVVEETGDSVTNTEEVSEAVSEETETIVEESVAEPESTEVASEPEEVSSEVTEETSEVTETTEAATVVETVETIVEEIEPTTVVDVMEDGDGYNGSEEPEGTLQIHMSMMENYSMEALLSILEVRKAEETRFEEVYLGFDEISLENNTIPEELWNAVYDVLKPESEEGLRRLIVRYFPENSSEYNEWEFRYPSKIETELDYDLVLGKTLILSEESNGGATISFVNTTFPCEQINFRTTIDNYGAGETLFNQYCTAFGTSENVKLEVYDTANNRVDNEREVYASYECRNSSAGLRVSCLGGNYEANKNYTLKLPPYKGSYDERTEDDGYNFQSLYLQPADVDKTSFTAEEIAEILSYYNEKSLDEITIVYRTDAMSGTADDAVISATLPYLKDSSEDRKSCTRITFQHTTTNEEFTWILVNPGEQTEEQNLTGSFAVDNNVATVSVGSQSFVAEGVNITVSRSNESDASGVAALKAIYGDEPTKLSVGNTTALAGFDMDDWSAWIWIDDVSQLTPNTTYTINKYVYKGHVDTWDDGRKELVINYNDAEKETVFTAQELLDILANYENYKVYNEDDYLSSIYIEQPSGENDTIYKTVADAAASLLPNGGELKFAFRNQETATSTEWLFEGIKAGVEQSGDQVVKAALTVSSNNLLEFSRGEFGLTAGDEGTVSIGYAVDTNEDTVLTKAVFDTFGEFEGRKQIETCDGEIDGEVNYDKDNNQIWIYLNSITDLLPGENYPLTSYFYRGDVEHEYDDEGNVVNTTLNINAHALEKDTFDTASFKQIVKYWTDRGVTFNYVSIEQSYTSNNVIKKDIYNAARALLADKYSGFTFIFCGCQMGEQNENGEEIKPFIQNDMNWHFNMVNKNATKDIKANVSLAKKGGGVSVVLPSNAYPAEHVHVQFYMDEGADMMQNVVIPALGKATPESSLVVLEKATTLKTLSNGLMPANYYEENGKASLLLECVEEWKAGIDNRLVEAYERPEAPIGEEASVVLFTYDPSDPDDIGYPPAEGDWSHPDQAKANRKFTLLTPDIATMGYRVNEQTGTRFDYMVPNVPWKTVYTLCTYTSVSDETCVEVLSYPTTVDISGLSFAEDVVNIEWDNGNQEHYGYLNVNTIPKEAQNHFNPQEFTWTVSQSEKNPVIELVTSPYYTWDEETQTDIPSGERPNGEFRVVGYGEATVTVTYRDLAPITCTINVLEPVNVPQIPSVFAIPAIDTKLSDLGEDLDALIRARGINADYEGRFDWKDDSISLAPYTNMEWAEFAAIYTAPDGRKVPTTVPVEMLRITDIGLYSAEIYERLNGENPDASQYVKTLRINTLNGSSIIKGDELVMGYQVGINREQTDEEGNMTPEFLTFARYISEGKLSINWKEKDILTLIDPIGDKPYDMTIDENVYNNGLIQKPSKYISTTKGKKTFTVEAVNELTKKVIFKSSAAIVVTDNPVFTFDNVEIDGLNDETLKGNFLLKVNAEDYAVAKKLTIKSADTSTLKLGSIKVKTTETESGKVEITIPYEFKKYGKTVLSVTAADEVKTSEAYAVERVDYDPKIPNTNYTIDKSWTIGSGADAVYQTTDVVNIALQHNTAAAGIVTIEEENYKDVFKLVGSVENAVYYVQLVNPSLVKNNKTYTLTLKIPYTINGDESGTVKETTQKIKVKIIQSNVKVTAKQTKKINEFYKLSSVDSQGVITLKTPGELSSYSLNTDSVFDLKVNEDSSNGYDEFTFNLVLKEGQNISKLTTSQKKIVLNYKLKNGEYEHNGFVNVTLKSENKKPSLVLPKKTETLYPGMNVDGSVFVVMNKATGELIDLAGNTSVVLNKSKNITVPVTSEFDEQSYSKVGKNNYYILANGVELNYWLYDSTSAVKATDKFIIRVQQEHWNNYVELTYSAKIDLSTPKLKLDSKTLTINANDDVYRYQTAATHINLTGYAGTQFDELWISGVKDADKNALKNNLSYTWNREESKIQIIIDNKGVKNTDTYLKNGNYKFKVWTILNGKKLSTDLTLKVVDKQKAKAVKVTKKGSLDVLRRNTTQITMNPKFTNLSGELVDFRLTGTDGDLFDYYYDWETGNCIVMARPGVNYSTKINYKVTPVYRLSDNGDYEVEGKAQTVKVTQGKPKVSTWSNTSTIYGDKSIGALIGFEAVLKNEFVNIQNVELLNYTNDLEWCWEPMMDEKEENFVDYDDPNAHHPLLGAGRLTLNGNTPKDITKASGKYTLKFAVTYTDAAGNEKATQVNYKLNIVR